MTTLADKIEALAQGDHKHGCGGRAYSCTCGYDEDLYLALDQAVIALRERDQAVEALRALLEEDTHHEVDTGIGPMTEETPAAIHARTTLASIEGTGHE